MISFLEDLTIELNSIIVSRFLLLVDLQKIVSTFELSPISWLGHESAELENLDLPANRQLNTQLIPFVCSIIQVVIYLLLRISGWVNFLFFETLQLSDTLNQFAQITL